MATHYFGSIDYDKLLTDLKAGRLKTYKTKSGIRLINVNVYVSDAPNQYGDIASISVPLKEEFQTEDNGKKNKQTFCWKP